MVGCDTMTTENAQLFVPLFWGGVQMYIVTVNMMLPSVSKALPCKGLPEKWEDSGDGTMI